MMTLSLIKVVLLLFGAIKLFEKKSESEWGPRGQRWSVSL